MCTCIRTCTSCLPASPCLLHPICILTWRRGSFCVCFIHLRCGYTAWLECVYALVHVYMSTWLPMSTQTSLHSYMETWVPLCGSVFPQLVWNVYMHQYMYLCQPEFWMSAPSPICIVTVETWMSYCVADCVFWSHLHFCSQTLVRMCTCISICNLSPVPDSPCLLPPHLHTVTWKDGVSLCGTVRDCHSQLYLWSHILGRMCTHIRTWIYASFDSPFQFDTLWIVIW